MIIASLVWNKNIINKNLGTFGRLLLQRHSRTEMKMKIIGEQAHTHSRQPPSQWL